MITEQMRSVVEKARYAFVASADATGFPHLAAGGELSVPDAQRLVFNAWFCNTTLRNLEQNPRLCVAVVDPASGEGFQFVGRVEKIEAAAFLDGLAPGEEPPGLPQVESRLALFVEAVMAFSAAAHSDVPLG